MAPSFTLSHRNGFTYLHCADGRVLQVPSGSALDDHDLVALERAGGELTSFSPAKTFMRRKALKAVAEAAARLGDITRLREAVAEKLEEEAAFAAHVQGLFQHGGPRKNGHKTHEQDDPGGVLLTLPDYCERHGFKARTVQKWYRLLDDSFREAETEKRAAKVLRLVLGESAVHVAQNSGEFEWYTPAPYIEAARATMGTIDLDPCSTAVANEVVKAAQFFTAAEDDLTQEWGGCVWMNPPYAQPLITDFLGKLVAEVDTQRVTQAVVIVNNGTETRWGGIFLNAASALCFPCGRVKFWHPKQESAPPPKKSTPLQGQVVAYLGPNANEFVTHFEKFGPARLWRMP